MKRIWKKDDAVSPVIATILMVAITVVLAAVLYVMVSGLLGGTGDTVTTMGVDKGKSGDGTRWILTIVDTPSGLTTGGTFIEIFKPDGSINLTKTDFAALDLTGEGAEFSGDGDTTVEVGERVLLSATWYAIGSKVQISDGTRILWSGTL